MLQVFLISFRSVLFRLIQLFRLRIAVNAFFFLVHPSTNSQAKAPENDVDRWSFANAAPFPIKYTIEQTRFQSKIPSNRWFIALIFRRLNNHGGLAWVLKPIRRSEIFQMNYHLTQSQQYFSFPSNHSWATCPDGYFLKGFYFSNGSSFSNIEHVSCCRPRNFENVHLQCHEKEQISLQSQRWATCEAWSYLVGFYGAPCDGSTCIEKLRCCRMPLPGNHSRLIICFLNYMIQVMNVIE